MRGEDGGEGRLGGMGEERGYTSQRNGTGEHHECTKAWKIKATWTA
jgi:hypothetical protein